MSIFLRGLRGFAEGILVDTGTWMLTAYFPGLTRSTSLRIPGYDPDGIHWDDLLSQLVAFGVTIYGGVTWNPEVFVEGLGMGLGAFVLSRHQACNAQKPW